MGPIWTGRTQVGPMLAPRTLLSGLLHLSLRIACRDDGSYPHWKWQLLIMWQIIGYETACGKLELWLYWICHTSDDIFYYNARYMVCFICIIYITSSIQKIPYIKWYISKTHIRSYLDPKRTWFVNTRCKRLFRLSLHYTSLCVNMVM